MIYHSEARGDLPIGNAFRNAPKPYAAWLCCNFAGFDAVHTRENTERAAGLICQIPCEGWRQRLPVSAG
ncbi:hypothetical protein PUN4_350031 [Paraburkholderia unamae]|nr:hypothetical protein PUN4_350031 [Paraburkholderia unamae]